jgi:hypothetical protein
MVTKLQRKASGDIKPTQQFFKKRAESPFSFNLLTNQLHLKLITEHHVGPRRRQLMIDVKVGG